MDDAEPDFDEPRSLEEVTKVLCETMQDTFGRAVTPLCGGGFIVTIDGKRFVVNVQTWD